MDRDPGDVASSSPLEDEFVDRILSLPESLTLETKRVGDNKGKLKTVVAFANSEGRVLVLGIEDPEKAEGRNRVFGVGENPESVDELRRSLANRVTPPLAGPHSEPPVYREIGCTLKDGSRGAIAALVIAKSKGVHSVVDGGTYVRLPKSNRQISAAEITELSMRRGATSVVNGLVDVPITLLETSYWRDYASQRRLTRPIQEAMQHLGLAREENGVLRPTRASVLLFAEEPNGLLDSKCGVRIFHFKGDVVEHLPSTNLGRPPRTITGPLVSQIREATKAVLENLAGGVQVSPLGFEIAQRYPIRVIQEAITNAVIHRDYRLSADIHIRIFGNRIEIDSPGLLPGGVTVAGLGTTGSRPRNRAIVDHLREFPSPPNLDAGEGIRMMQRTMDSANLYPPIFLSAPDVEGERVVVYLFNEARPSIWAQVQQYVDSNGQIGNAEVRALLKTDDRVRASKLLKSWVDLGLLVPVDPAAGKRSRRYRRPGKPPESALFSKELGKQEGG